MAYALQFDGVNDYVTLSSMVGGAYADRVNVNQDWSLTFRFARAGASTYVHRLLSSTSGTSDELLMRKSDGLFRVTGLSGSHSWSGVPMPTTETEYRLERVVGTKQLELFVDSVSQGTRTGIVTIFNFNVVGVKGASGYINGKLYSLSYDSVNSGASLYLDPSATGGTGSILEDTVGTNNGTLVNFPTDNSQWVRYDVFPTEFTRLGSLTTPSVTGSASDLPTLVKYEDFTSTMLASLDAGGGDLRFSSDEAGTTQLACEVVTFTKATGDVVWVKVPAVSTGALIYVWGDNTGATQPAVDAAFGRNAVWSAFSFYSHDGGVTESTASLAMIDDGSGAVGTGQPSGADDLTAPKQRLSDASIGDTVGNYTLTSWHNGNSAGTFISRRDGSINQYQTGLTGSGSIFEYFYQDSSGTFTQFAGSALSGWHKADYVITGTSCELFIDGVSRNTIVISKGSQPAVPLRLGFRGNGGLGTVGFAYANRIGESSVCSSAKSSTQIDIEYDNQSATGAWWTATDEGGGGPVTQILTPTAIASLETWGSPSVYNVLQILAASGIATGELWGAHTVSTTSGTSILQPSGVASLESWGTPVVTPLIVQLVATAISSLEAWGTPSVLSGVSVLTATGVSSEEAWGTVTLSNLKQYLLASGVISAEAWGNPVLEVLLKVLVAQSIVSGEAWGLPLLAGGDALVVPVAYRQTYNDIAAFLRTQLIKGQDNEVILKWLSNEGYIGNFNEALDDYLRDLGKAGGLQDKFANWRDE